jgi:hypothetical protein
MLGLALFGIGQGLFISPNNSAIVAAAPASTCRHKALGNATQACNVVTLRPREESDYISRARSTSSRRVSQPMNIPVSTYGAHERAESPGGRDYGPDEAKKYGRTFRSRRNGS